MKKKTQNLWLIVALIMTINLVFYIFKPGGNTLLLYVSDLLPVICSFIAVVCLTIAYRRFKTFDKTKLSWLMILIGIFIFFIAESTYAYLEIYKQLDMNEIFPTAADIFWCNGYIPLIAGMTILFIAYKRSGFPMGNLNLYYLFSIIFLVTVSVVIYFLFIPILKDSEISTITKVYYFFYPIADLFLVVPAVLLMYITSLFGNGIISKPIRLIAIGFTCLTIGDLLYSVLSWQDIYGSGNPIDVAWNFGYLAIAMAGLYQKELIESFN